MQKYMDVGNHFQKNNVQSKSLSVEGMGGSFAIQNWRNSRPKKGPTPNIGDRKQSVEDKNAQLNKVVGKRNMGRLGIKTGKNRSRVGN